MSDLKSAKNISLRRVENGWIAREGDGGNFFEKHQQIWVFNSTAALCRALPLILGESSWEVQPARDAKGHFVKAAKDLIPPVIFKKAV